MSVPEATVEQLASELAAPDAPVVLDVREEFELSKSRIEPFIHIPLGELADRFTELDASRPTVVVCRTGNRSGTAARFLLDQGFDSVRNLVGGLNEWVERVDPSMERY